MLWVSGLRAFWLLEAWGLGGPTPTAHDVGCLYGVQYSTRPRVLLYIQGLDILRGITSVWREAPVPSMTVAW